MFYMSFYNLFWIGMIMYFWYVCMSFVVCWFLYCLLPGHYCNWELVLNWLSWLNKGLIEEERKTVLRLPCCVLNYANSTWEEILSKVLSFSFCIVMSSTSLTVWKLIAVINLCDPQLLLVPDIAWSGYYWSMKSIYC